MLLALILASGSALLGGALALLVRKQRALLEVTRTFAFSAAAGVVLLHLLPGSLEELGAGGLVFAAIGFALPGLLEWRARSLAPSLRARGFSSARVAAEVGFLALFVHSLLEGVALCAAAKGSGPHVDLEIALVAHHAPLTAAVILPFLGLLGAGGVALRVLGIAGAGAAGALFGGFSPIDLSNSTAQQIAQAVMAGVLLHVVADEIRKQEFHAVWERSADLFAAFAGAGIALVSALFSGSLVARFGGDLLFFLLPAAPFLLAGDLLEALPAGALSGKRALAPFPELDAALVSAGAFGIFAGVAQLSLAFAGWAIAGSFAPGDGRPPDPERGFFDRVLTQAQRRGPRRLCALLLGEIALWLLSRALHDGATDAWPPALAALGCALAILFCAALSASITALFAAWLLAASIPFAPAIAQLLPLLALAPLLVRRSMWRGNLRKRLTSALLLLLLGSVASILLTRPWFLAQAESAARAFLGHPPAHPTQLLEGQPIGAAALALLFAVALASLARAGTRGWFVALRHGEGTPQEGSSAAAHSDPPPSTAGRATGKSPGA